MPGRLERSRSPYLRMHADDPVDWFPWGDEAFAKAAEEDRPVLLSVGYASCHWCHVMQRESFRDAETAALLNERFVAVKVDREERPDIDSVYMDYVTATAGSGGWPMTVFLTPDRLPLIGGTYFPKTAPPDGISFLDLLREVDRAYREDRERLAETSRTALAFLVEMAEPKQPGPITWTLVDMGAELLMLSLDRENGGLGDGPKFPQVPALLFLTDYARLAPDEWVAIQARRWALAMVRGGIYDQAGGGICRYAVDERWRVPHFEKMLYDQALLLRALAVITSDGGDAEELAHCARQTAAFLEREMRLADGCYASALSADADGVEGATYVWTVDELARALTSEQLDLARLRLGVTDEGDLDGANVLARPGGRAEDAEAVDAVLERLLEVRGERPRPGIDDKAIVSWNAMLARGLIEAGAAFGEKALGSRGRELLGTLLERTGGGADVPHVLGDPDVAGVRLIEDHAHLAAACIAAHAASGEPTLLETALALHAHALELFLDGDVLYMTPARTDLPVRPREQHDNPTPSGASTTVENAIALARLTGDQTHLELARNLLPRWWAVADYAPAFGSTALSAMAVLLKDSG